MRQIEVTGQSCYNIQVESGLLQTIRIDNDNIVLIYPTDLPEIFVEQANKSLRPVIKIAVPARDECKTIQVFADTLSRLAQAALPRSSAVVGLGGGAVTDLAGFVAASYLRGVDFYTIPTTLLGMVDAAVGGKTGINLPEGKNLAGAFYPPKAVWCDLDTLSTLSPEVFREGAAEAFKHGLISDASLLERVLNVEFRPNGKILQSTVAGAIAVKAGVVSRDLTEKGERAFLNFGHTLAHALEAFTNQALPHGEAVAYGMHYAACLSLAMGGNDVTEYTKCFISWQKPTKLPNVTFEELLPYIYRDKKSDSGGVRWVLLRDVAKPYLVRVDESILRREFRRWQEDTR